MKRCEKDGDVMCEICFRCTPGDPKDTCHICWTCNRLYCCDCGDIADNMCAACKEWDAKRRADEFAANVQA